MVEQVVDQVNANLRLNTHEKEVEQTQKSLNQITMENLAMADQEEQIKQTEELAKKKAIEVAARRAKMEVKIRAEQAMMESGINRNAQLLSQSLVAIGPVAKTEAEEPKPIVIEQLSESKVQL